MPLLMQGAVSDKVALVTGAASGIGRATAELLAAEGAALALVDIRETRPIAARIEAHGGAALCLRADVSQASELEAAFERAEERYHRLDIMVACAGIGGGTSPTADYAEADFDRTIAVNLKGVFLAMRCALPRMIRSGGGSIVNIASVMGLVGLTGTPAYCAAKGGVIQLTRSAALEYADRGVRVNAICPGMIDTPILRNVSDAGRRFFVERQPIGRLGAPEEVAQLALFLASGASSFATGAIFPLDGGYTAH